MLEIERIIAHRGASAYAPENTLAAFDKALAMGSRFIEFDVMLSKDGDAFIFHDATLNRKTNGRGEFNLAASDYLRSLDAGNWFSHDFQGEKIPTLSEVIDWLIHSNAQANIEIKPYPGYTEQAVIAVVTQVHCHWPKEKALPLISSFDLNALRLCRRMAPDMPIGLLLDKWRDDWLQLAKELDCFSIHLNKRALNAAAVAEIKQQGYKVCAYTVNRKSQAARLFAWGVDAIFSDYPDLLL